MIENPQHAVCSVCSVCQMLNCCEAERAGSMNIAEVMSEGCGGLCWKTGKDGVIHPGAVLKKPTADLNLNSAQL